MVLPTVSGIESPHLYFIEDVYLGDGCLELMQLSLQALKRSIPIIQPSADKKD